MHKLAFLYLSVCMYRPRRLFLLSGDEKAKTVPEKVRSPDGRALYVHFP